MKIKSFWQQLSNLGITPSHDNVEVLKMRILNQILWFGLFVCIIFSIIFIAFNFQGVVVTITYLLNFCYAFALYLIYKKRYLLAHHLTATLILGVILYNVLTIETYTGVMYLLFPISAAVYFIIKRPYILYYNISFFIIIGIYWVRYLITYTGEYNDAFYNHNLQLFTLAITLFALIAILDFFDQALRHYVRDNTDKRRLLEDAQSIAKSGSWSFHVKEGYFTPSTELRKILHLNDNQRFKKEAFLNILPPDYQALLKAQINLDTRKPLDEVYPLQLNGSMKYFRFKSEYKTYEDRTAQIIGNIQDITLATIQRLKNDELLEDLKRSNHELEQFAYIASHDLQEPLRMVGNFVQLLEEEYGDAVGDEGKLYIEYAVNGVSRMSRQIDELLQYSRVGRKEEAMRSVNVRDLVNDKLTDMLGYIKERHANVRLGNLDISVTCVPNQLELIFQNLIHNAIKFNKKDQPLVLINCKQNEHDTLFSVKDNGIGIAPENQDKIFEIFKRLHRKEVYQGTGIGLALVKRIVHRHGGKIWIESDLGEGTTFFFTIPR